MVKVKVKVQVISRACRRMMMVGQGQGAGGGGALGMITAAVVGWESVIVYVVIPPRPLAR